MIEIKEVKTKRDLKKFILFSNKLYKKNKNYVPPLVFDEMDFFNRNTNPSYDFCRSKEFLAYKDGKIVGRISGLINDVYNEKVNKKYIRFNHFDFIEDLEVARALLNAVAKFGIDEGMEEFDGPLGCTDLDKQGMLLEGFDEPGMYITYYNYPYYIKFMEELGFEKDVDFIEYKVMIPEKTPDRIEKVSQVLQARYGYKLLEFKKFRDLKPHLNDLFNILNKAFESLDHTVPITDRQVKTYVNTYLKLMNFDYVKMVEDQSGKAVGMAVLAPSLAKSSRKSHGKLFPFGWIRILYGMKHAKVLDMYFIGVLPEYQMKGVNAIMIDAMGRSAHANGVKYAETGPELEHNLKVQKQWNDFEKVQNRKKRIWKRKVEIL